MNGTRPWRAFTSFLGFLGLAAAVLPALAAERPNLQGRWTLNEDLTARLQARDREQGELPGALEGWAPGPADRSRPPVGPGPTEGPPLGGGDPLGPPEGLDERRETKAPAFSLTALNELAITQTESEITIVDKEGRTRVLKPNGSKVRDEKAPGGPEDVRASWQKDGTLLVKARPQDGPDRTESYVVSNDRKHLYLTLVLEGDILRRELKIRRAYNLAK